MEGEREKKKNMAHILSACEVVPEAYGQKFRRLKNLDSYTYVEFACEKIVLFDCWCSAQGVKKF